MAASAPAVGGHGVNPTRLPFPVLSLSVSLRLWVADGSKALEERKKVWRRVGGEREEVTGGADTPGFPPANLLPDHPLRHGRMSCTTRRWIPDKQTPP